MIQSTHYEIAKRSSYELSVRKKWIKGIASQAVFNLSSRSDKSREWSDVYAPFDMLWLNEMSPSSQCCSLLYRSDLFNTDWSITFYTKWNEILRVLVSGDESLSMTCQTSTKIKLYRQLKDYSLCLSAKKHLFDYLCSQRHITNLNTSDLSLD